METKTKVKKKKKKKREREKDNLRLHFYYKLILLSLGRLGGGRRGGCWSITFEVFLGGYGESCQRDLHVVGSLFLLGGEGLWGRLEAGGHHGPLLGGVCCLSRVLKLLYYLRGDVSYGKSFGWAFLAFTCLFGDQVSLGAWGADG